MRLPLIELPWIDGDGCNSGVEFKQLLMSFPKRRAALVKARGRPLDLGGGAGEISIGSAYSYSGVRVIESLGGEFNETLEAKDNSRSEERKSSTSSRGREVASAPVRFRTSATGALKNLSEV